ncbi:hypothetical protein ACFE04_014403 [Oxalis oulophora]
MERDREHGVRDGRRVGNGRGNGGYSYTTDSPATGYYGYAVDGSRQSDIKLIISPQPHYGYESFSKGSKAVPTTSVAAPTMSVVNNGNENKIDRREERGSSSKRGRGQPSGSTSVLNRLSASSEPVVIDSVASQASMRKNSGQLPPPTPELKHELPPIQRPVKDRAPSTLESKRKLYPVHRPDAGGKSSIRTAKIRANHFPVKFDPESILRHYDIDVRPELLPKNGRPVKISKSNLSLIRNKLFADNPAEFPLEMTAYDGEKNIFSAVPLPTGKFKVKLAEAEDTKMQSYTFTIKLVNELKFRKLKDYVSGSLFSIPRDVLQGMDIVMKENPARNMISVGRSFHPAESTSENDLGFGITASSGFQHSLKPTKQGLVMCLDYSVLAFRKRLPVLDFLSEHIPGFSLTDFRKSKGHVEKALRGLKVGVTHRRTNQKYVIAAITKKNTRDLSFMVEDPNNRVPPRRVKLVDYFLDKYDKDISYKDIPCLDLGKNNRINYVPMEFCVLVEGQIYPKENLDRDAAFVLKNLSLAPPREREKNISNMVQADNGPCGGGIIQNFGIEVNKNMTLIDGRIIGPPLLKLNGPNGKPMKITVNKDNCQWNLMGKRVVEGKSLDRWALIDFSLCDRFRLNPDPFVSKLISRCRSLGMYMEKPLVYQSAKMNVLSNVDDLRQLLESVTAEGKLQIIIVVMTRKDPGYKNLKWISETQIGVVTQCCLSSHANQARDQYLANLALKINAKLGGSNVELMDKLPYFEGDDHVMFMGADVNHPGSWNTTSPSIAAVVATVNWPAANIYAARVRPQEHRTEKISNFGEMCLELVETYTRRNRVRPGKIVVFRDGVSDGQFDMVLNEELLDMKKSFETIQYFPTITLIVAQKRHQTRLFPRSQRDSGRSGNVPPGTVVDTKIVHPFEFDFYLCSHYGSLGTSKPTHYHVLFDEHHFSSDELQKLIYNMCFTFARCTKPVSLVPPVYYADLVAYRGRLYHEAMMEGLSPASGTSSSSSLASSSSLSTSSFDERSYRLHDEVQNMMFFV